MKKQMLMLSVCVSLLLGWMPTRSVLAAQASKSMLDAKRELENKGYTGPVRVVEAS
jgi:hypothetical protein